MQNSTLAGAGAGTIEILLMQVKYTDLDMLINTANIFHLLRKSPLMLSKQDFRY
jgi:hypothetical protein